jgi:hypothetical protein
MVKKWSEYKAAHRAKDKEQGLQRVEFRLPAHLVAKVRAYVEKLLKGERS